MLKNNDFKHQLINLKNIIGFSLLLSSSYYFYKYSSFANKDMLAFSIDFFILFIFSIIFFLLIKNVFRKIKLVLPIKICNLLFNFFLTYLFVQTIRGFLYLINSKLTISNVILENITFLENFSILSNRLTIFLLPFVICFLMIFFNHKRLREFIRFFSIVGFVFFAVLIFREISNQLMLLKISKEALSQNFKYVKNNTIENNKKVLWIIFDGFDPQITFNEKKIIKNLPTFKIFKENAVFHGKMYPPAEKTINSLPAILMGLETNGHLIKDKKYYLKKKDNSFIEFNYENSIFGRLNKIGFSSSVFSSVLEYCSAYIFPNNFNMCLERTKKTKKSTISYFDGVYFTFLPINKINYLISMFVNKNEKTFKKKINYEDYYNINIIEQYITSNDLDGFNTIFVPDVKKSIEDSSLTFVHLYIPHPGNQSYAEKLSGKFPDDDFASYLINLKLSDIALMKLTKLMQKYDDHMIILSSDHWFRSRDRNRSNVYPALFLSKISNQNQPFIIEDTESSSIYIQEIVYRFFTSEIKNHEDIVTYLKSKTEHSTYVNFNN